VLGLVRCDGVFVIESGREFRDLVWVDVHSKGVVLRLEPRVLCGRGEADADAFAGAGPVGGAFEGDDAVEHTTLGVADLVAVGLADGEVSRVRRRVLCGVRR
jgi:hypothetical protein